MRPFRPLCASLALFVLAPGAAPVHAQAGAAQPAPPSASAFPNEPYVITKALSVITVNPDATSTRLLTFAVLVRSDAALRQFGVVTASFAGKSEHVDITYVRVTHPDGTTQETPVVDAMEEPAPVTREAPFYSDIKIKELPIKSLHLGDTLEWQAKWTVDHPEVPGQLWGQDTFIRGAVALDETYELRVPASLHITAWTNPTNPTNPATPDAAATFTESSEGATHIYRWHSAELKPTIGPAADAFNKAEETRRRTPAEELDLTKGALPSFSWSTFPDWAAVGAWYRTLTADRTTPDAAIRAKVAELTANKSTDLEKAQAVYTFVSSQIRYIGVAFGIGRYQPHTAAEIFANQYGDCKDKHTLLASMLSVLNLHAEPVLIGEGIRFNRAVASPSDFNHLITRLNLDGKDILLDSTAEVGPWAALIAPIRDQEALVVPSASPAILIKTPENLPYPVASTFAVTGSLDKDLTSDSKIVYTLRGDDEIYIRAALRTVSPSNYSVLVQQLMANMGFGGTTSDPSFEHIDDTTQPLKLTFHYHRLKEKDWGDNRIVASFLQIGLPAFTAERPPVIAIQLGVPRTETSTVEMHLPEGWTAQLPEPVHAHTPFATCDVTYHFIRGTLIEERRLVILKKEVPLTDLKQYQSWYDDSGASGYPYIQLVRQPKAGAVATAPQPKAPEPPPASAEPAKSDPQAWTLVREAAQQSISNDLDAARSKLDEAAKINPTEAFLWSGYGLIAGRLGKMHEAVEDLQHELSYHPDEDKIYLSLVELQRGTNDMEGSLVTLQAWEKAMPSDPKPAVLLARALQTANRSADGLIEAEAAIARMQSSKSDLTQLYIVAAQAQLSLGQKAEAAARVTPLLASTSDPADVNGIDSVLAASGTHLDEASAAQRKAIAASEAESQGWTTEEDLRPIMRKQVTLAAEWDTMGWILFQQGDLPEAVTYIGAALHATEDTVTRDHYAKVAAALHTPAASKDSHLSEQEMRTFPLGPAHGRHGVAAFDLLLADGKVLTASSRNETSASTPNLPGAYTLVKAADLRALFPPASSAHLIRRGFVNCTGDRCELVLSPNTVRPLDP